MLYLIKRLPRRAQKREREGVAEQEREREERGGVAICRHKAFHSFS